MEPNNRRATLLQKLVRAENWELCQLASMKSLLRSNQIFKDRQHVPSFSILRKEMVDEIESRERHIKAVQNHRKLIRKIHKRSKK